MLLLWIKERHETAVRRTIERSQKAQQQLSQSSRGRKPVKNGTKRCTYFLLSESFNAVSLSLKKKKKKSLVRLHALAKSYLLLLPYLQTLHWSMRQLHVACLWRHGRGIWSVASSPLHALIWLEARVLLVGPEKKVHPGPSEGLFCFNTWQIFWADHRCSVFLHISSFFPSRTHRHVSTKTAFFLTPSQLSMFVVVQLHASRRLPSHPPPLSLPNSDISQFQPTAGRPPHLPPPAASNDASALHR